MENKQAQSKTETKKAFAPIVPTTGKTGTDRPAPVVTTSAGFGSRAEFEKARSLDFD